MDSKHPGGWYFGWNIVGAATVARPLLTARDLGIGPFFLPMADRLELAQPAVGHRRGRHAGYGLGMPLAGYLVNARFVLLGTAIVVAILWTVYARGPVEFLRNSPAWRCRSAWPSPARWR